jgi:hypothetical protein
MTLLGYSRCIFDEPIAVAFENEVHQMDRDNKDITIVFPDKYYKGIGILKKSTVEFSESGVSGAIGISTIHDKESEKIIIVDEQGVQNSLEVSYHSTATSIKYPFKMLFNNCRVDKLN